MTFIFRQALLILLISISACTQKTVPPPEPTQTTSAPVIPPPSPAPTSSPTPVMDVTPPETSVDIVDSPLPAPTEITTPAGSTANPDLDYAQVQFVQASQGNDQNWRFDVTVRHNDQGWDHYADLWQVEDMDGNILGERVLAHPHDSEQPFTRSQSGISVPPEVTQVRVRAKCNVHGFGGQDVVVNLTATEGPGFEVVSTN